MLVPPLLQSPNGESAHENERNQWQYPPSFARSTYSDCADSGLEYELEEAEKYSWDCANRLSQDVPVERISEVTKNGTSFAVGQGVADEEPLNRTDDHSKDGWDNGRKRVGACCVA